jgi:hypothetical protein
MGALQTAASEVGELAYYILSKLFRREQKICQALDIMLWWETRRLFYNFIVGLSVVGIIYLLSFGDDIGIIPPFFTLIPCGVLFNIIYTFTWISEIIYKYRNVTKGWMAFLVGLVILFPMLSLLAILLLW